MPRYNKADLQNILNLLNTNPNLAHVLNTLLREAERTSATIWGMHPPTDLYTAFSHLGNLDPGTIQRTINTMKSLMDAGIDPKTVPNELRAAYDILSRIGPNVVENARRLLQQNPGQMPKHYLYNAVAQILQNIDMANAASSASTSSVPPTGATPPPATTPLFGAASMSRAGRLSGLLKSLGGRIPTRLPWGTGLTILATAAATYLLPKLFKAMWGSDDNSDNLRQLLLDKYNEVAAYNNFLTRGIPPEQAYKRAIQVIAKGLGVSEDKIQDLVDMPSMERQKVYRELHRSRSPLPPIPLDRNMFHGVYPFVPRPIFPQIPYPMYMTPMPYIPHS